MLDMTRPASLGLGASDLRSLNYGAPRSTVQPFAYAPSWVSEVKGHGRKRESHVDPLAAARPDGSWAVQNRQFEIECYLHPALVQEESV